MSPGSPCLTMVSPSATGRSVRRLIARATVSSGSLVEQLEVRLGQHERAQERPAEQVVEIVGVDRQVLGIDHGLHAKAAATRANEREARATRLDADAPGAAALGAVRPTPIAPRLDFPGQQHEVVMQASGQIGEPFAGFGRAPRAAFEQRAQLLSIKWREQRRGAQAYGQLGKMHVGTPHLCVHSARICRGTDCPCRPPLTIAKKGDIGAPLPFRHPGRATCAMTRRSPATDRSESPLEASGIASVARRNHEAGTQAGFISPGQH